MDATTTQRARAGLKKIRHQFPKTPEGQLFYAVIDQAVSDVVANEPRIKSNADIVRHLMWQRNRRSAVEYLNSDMPHATEAGVDPEWIRRVFKLLQVDFSDLDLQFKRRNNEQTNKP